MRNTERGLNKARLRGLFLGCLTVIGAGCSSLSAVIGDDRLEASLESLLLETRLEEAWLDEDNFRGRLEGELFKPDDECRKGFGLWVSVGRKEYFDKTGTPVPVYDCALVVARHDKRTGRRDCLIPSHRFKSPSPEGVLAEIRTAIFEAKELYD